MIEVMDLGRIDYIKALNIQKELVWEIKGLKRQDTLLVCEHQNIFTIGRCGSRENLLADEKVLSDKGLNVLQVARGGDITFHGIGQIILYPLLDLRNYGKDILIYLNALEDVVIDFLKKYSIKGESKEGLRGVWVSDEKIASIGIGATNWVSYHGLSINIANNLEYFKMINPCGIKGCQMTSLTKLLGPCAPGAEETKRNLISSFLNIFNNMRTSYENLPIVA